MPNRLVAMVMSAVTGSPCLVKISIPEPIMLKPMNVPMPKARTISVPTMLMLKDDSEKEHADSKVNCYDACAPDKAPNGAADDEC